MKHYDASGNLCGLVTDIQKYTIHDGPGIRTEFFFKGCPLHCPWCSNPETISPHRQIGVYPTKCIGKDKCSWCIRGCPEKENSPICFNETGELVSLTMTDSCRNCLVCADRCPGGALKAWGKLYSVDELLKIAEEDRSFYNRSGGGITVSGGDVIQQWEFVSEFLNQCRSRKLNICVETEACCTWEQLEAVIRYADLVIFDIKHIDSDRHKQITGVPNEVILENIRRAAREGHRMVIRTPVVIGYNADEETIAGIASFIKNEVGPALVQYQLLPYRKMGIEKYDSLGMAYPMGDYVPPQRSEWEPKLLELKQMVSEQFGIEVAAGTAGKLPL